MREIKFRGKSILTDEWFYGDLVHSADKKRTAILVNDKDSYDECEVVPETIGQFTGLYDCEGKEIFEGDILRFGNSQSGVCEVKWNEHIAAFCIRFYFKDEIGSRPLGGGVEFAIIGNIHDNPELLKGGEK